MTRLLDIGVDIDEVLYSFVGAMRHWFAGLGHFYESMPEPTTWDFSEVEWGINRVYFHQACDEAVDAGYLFREGDPFPGSALALQRLAEYGRVHLVTNRHHGTSNNARLNTLNWLSYHRLPYDSLTFTDDKASAVRCDLYLDDNPGNYAQLDKAGMRPYLLTHPWNEKYTTLRRVKSLMEFADVVERRVEAEQLLEMV